MRVPLTFLLLLCFLLGSSSANSSPEFTRKDYGNYCKWEWQPCGATSSLIAQYFSSFILTMCLCVLFMFSFQAPAPQEGGAKVEVFNNSFCLPSFLHYFCTIWIVPAFFFIKSGSLCPLLCCDFFPESEIRARLQSASPTACRCKTAWDTLIHFAAGYATPHKATKHLYLSVFIQRATWIVEHFYCLVTLEQYVFWIMLLSNSLAQYWMHHPYDTPPLPTSHACLHPWHFN